MEAGDGSILSITEQGLWLRQGDAVGQIVIQAARANTDGTVLYDVTFLTFETAGPPTGRIEAQSARLEPGYWVLDGAKVWRLDGANPEKTAVSNAAPLRIATDLTQDRLRDSFGTPSSVAFWNLPAYIRGLEKAGFSARSYQVWFQMEMATPLLLSAMVLIAAGFTMRHARFGKTGSMVLLALMGGFLIFFLRNFAQVLGENGQIPVLVAAWSPPIGAVLMALGLLLHLEDG
jgi:lipopolysaccharide export system permease protein